MNVVLPQRMRTKYQLAIAALPIGLMFASFVPLWHFANWLERYSAKDAWIIGFLGAMVPLMLGGYAVGWVANAVVSRYVLGWSPDQVRAVYLHSDVPSHWLKEGIATANDANLQSIAAWEAQRKIGALRFIGTRGVLGWGGPMLLAIYIVPTFVKGQSFTLGATLINLAVWACAGAGFGAFLWYSSESNYRKLKKGLEA